MNINQAAQETGNWLVPVRRRLICLESIKASRRLEETVTAMHQLREAAKIVTVVNVISEIADQTNLFPECRH